MSESGLPFGFRDPATPYDHQEGELTELRLRTRTVKEMVEDTRNQIERTLEQLDDDELDRNALESRMRKLASNLRQAADNIDPDE